jgi:hypothetical protein
VSGHPDDEFHTPTPDDPSWAETCWFTFTVPERKLSGQLYPYFSPNIGAVAGAAIFWDELGDDPSRCRYFKHVWHMPMPTGSLTDLSLPNGIRYRCLEPQRRFAVQYVDADAGDLTVDLVFEAAAPPHYLGESHLDQPGRFTGTIVLDGETIAVDAFGFRDRSWGHRPQIGPHIQNSGAEHGGYSYATASDRDAFHSITLDWGTGCVNIHGYLLRDGAWAALASGTREVVERDPVSKHPTRVRFEGADTLGRRLVAEGEAMNSIGILLNSNLYSVNGLYRWTFSDGEGGSVVEAYGEDHDNWCQRAARRLLRP